MTSLSPCLVALEPVAGCSLCAMSARCVSLRLTILPNEKCQTLTPWERSNGSATGKLVGSPCSNRKYIDPFTVRYSSTLDGRFPGPFGMAKTLKFMGYIPYQPASLVPSINSKWMFRKEITMPNGESLVVFLTQLCSITGRLRHFNVSDFACTNGRGFKVAIEIWQSPAAQHPGCIASCKLKRFEVHMQSNLSKRSIRLLHVQKSHVCTKCFNNCL